VLKLRQAFERMGRRFWPVFSGVIVLEAQKRLYQGLPVAARASPPRLRAGAGAAGCADDAGKVGEDRPFLPTGIQAQFASLCQAFVRRFTGSFRRLSRPFLTPRQRRFSALIPLDHTRRHFPFQKG
jgi:hypothetical protein